MRIDHILFPVDFSEHSRALNSELEWLASHFNSRVTLLHVFEIPTSWYGSGELPIMTRQDILAYAESDKQRLKEYALRISEARIERVSVEDAAATHIAKLAAERNVDLIVMGTHGYGPFRRFLLGSVAMKVLHDVSCPVWTHSVHQGYTSVNRVSNILCAVELTDETVSLLRVAKRVAADFNASVRLVHTVPQTAYRRFNVDFTSLAEEEISKLQRLAGTNFPLRIKETSIAQDTAEVAVESNADLIVIGRGKVQRTFGSVRTHAYDIIRQAPCPVLSFSMDWQERDSLNVKNEEFAEPVIV